MKWIRDRVRSGEVLGGTWVVLGESVVTEIVGNAGFDWVVLDTEHGMGGRDRLLGQLQALEGTPAVPLVRVGSADPVEIKRVLDLGASGIVVPQVADPVQATAVVRAMRYPPDGDRGISGVTRPTKFALEFDSYLEVANRNLLCVVQIESRTGLEACEEIARVDGVDVLFVGPLDLSASLGIVGQFDQALFRKAVARIVAAATAAGKAAGTLLAGPHQVAQAIDDGFTFIGIGTDAGVLALGMSAHARSITERRNDGR
jgi:2-keto-3-deoxy-L-rhamnonate aldolase RhmA